MKRKDRLFLLLVLLAAVCSWKGWKYWREHQFDTVIAAAAKRYQADPALVKAVVWRETCFNPDAHGGAGELGLMQIRSVAALEWATSEHLANFHHEDCLDPRTNTLAGTWYLKKVLKRYSQADDPIPYALADYNAGRGNVLKWLHGPAQTNSAEFIAQIGFPSTRHYVETVMEQTAHYHDSNW